MVTQGVTQPLTMSTKEIALRYLGLPQDYTPCPEKEPILFLKTHLGHLPPHIAVYFSKVATPKQRAAIPTIRNRRLRYVNSKPADLSFDVARRTWADLWGGRERAGVEGGQEERDWVERDFLSGTEKHLGKLGHLLAEYEEEREAERVRALRWSQPVYDDFVPEEDNDSDDGGGPEPVENEEEKRESFERTIKERFIYGLLDVSEKTCIKLQLIVQRIDYDIVDWDELLDDNRDAEERWFDEE